MNCADTSNIPYPKIKIEQKNVEYAKLLFDDYAGLVSETTAIFLYSFQHISKRNKLQEFADIVQKISVTEMRHLEMLGETISLLGCIPCFKSIEDNCNTFWGSQNVDYTTNLQDMLLTDIASEQKAIKQYTKHKELINDRYIKQTINRILEDEYSHLTCFKKLYNSYTPGF